MADEADIAGDYIERGLQDAIDAIRAGAVIDIGTVGECNDCGEYSARIVRGRCCRCREALGE